MTSPYRSEIDSLRERKAALEQEVADIGSRLEEAQRRQKRMLDVIQIASPCSANWDDMLGDDRVRHCLSCEKNVYNLSALPSDEAEAFLKQHANGEVCVRMYRRADGTVMTADCPVGQKKKRRRRVALAVAGAGALALAAVHQRATTRMGAVRPSDDVRTYTDEPTAVQIPAPATTQHPVAMGRIRPPVIPAEK